MILPPTAPPNLLSPNFSMDPKIWISRLGPVPLAMQLILNIRDGAESPGPIQVVHPQNLSRGRVTRDQLAGDIGTIDLCSGHVLSMELLGVRGKQLLELRLLNSNGGGRGGRGCPSKPVWNLWLGFGNWLGTDSSMLVGVEMR